MLKPEKNVLCCMKYCYLCRRNKLQNVKSNITMTRKHLTFLLLSLLILLACSSKGEKAVTFQNEGNPLIRSCYTADPAPVVFDGRLYLYTGHDECFEDSAGYEGLYGFNITNWLCFSTDDMQTWTEHGVVLSPADFAASPPST